MALAELVLEQVATMELFAGAIGTFKNPASHRTVDYSDPTEAAEVVLLADLLMRLLDRVECAAPRLKRTECATSRRGAGDLGPTHLGLGRIRSDRKRL